MIDNNFHKKNGSFTLAEITSKCGGQLSDNAKQDILIDDIAPIHEAKKGHLTFLQNSKYAPELKNSKASACIIEEKYSSYAPEGIALIVVKNPYYTYSKVAEMFYGKEQETTEAPETANIALSAEIGENTKIYPGVYIGENVKIGDNCVIKPNAVITNAIIGDNCIIHPGVAIGQDGYGYAFENGKHNKVLQLGRVVIGNDVEIGANSTIDRGSNSDTVIGEGTKIDNLVMIGHNAKVGKHCIIVAQAGIAGSTETGDYCVFGGQAGIAGHIKIGNNVQVAGQSGVSRGLEDNAIVGGTPAVPIKDYHRQHAVLKKIIKGKN